MVLLSANGMLRTILILLIVWQVLRLIVRMQQRSNGAPPPRGTHWAPPDTRPPGEVRIEQVRRDEGRGSGTGAQGPVQDADFEEIK